MRIGMFMLTLDFFRSMGFVNREYQTWSGEGDEIAGNRKKHASDERMQMEYEEQLFEARKKRIAFYSERVERGQQRIAEREALRRKEEIVARVRKLKRKQLERESAVHIQRIFRGHKGKKDARVWALKKAEIGALNALLNYTATTIQRYYRGYVGRVINYETRLIMAQFMAEMRSLEADNDEEQYWETHPYTRFKRDSRAYIKSFFIAEHERKELGGARLTAEEQAEMEELENDYNLSESSSSSESEESSDGGYEEKEENSDDEFESSRRVNSSGPSLDNETNQLMKNSLATITTNESVIVTLTDETTATMGSGESGMSRTKKSKKMLKKEAREAEEARKKQREDSETAKHEG